MNAPATLSRRDVAERAALSRAHDRLMSAAVTAGMPGLDASAAAANVLAVLRHVVEESCEAREGRVGATYRYEQQHAEAMLAALVGGGL